MKALVRQTAIWLFVVLASRASATGYYGPAVYLEDGGRRVAASPEFYWELEVKRLARDFHPPEKLGARDLEPAATSDERKAWNDRVTAEKEAADFADALQTGRIKPPDPTEATRADAAARAVLNAVSLTNATTLPPEFPSEFADYHRAAFAYRLGPEHWEEARRGWEDLLKRPEAERHYRTVWATFMLGKLAMKRNDPAAIEWFQRVRSFAQSGFADSLGMAADSYGWEGRSEWKQDHPEKAAPLFLTQLALGDVTAIVSLKALVPDRQPVEGMLNYRPEPEEQSGWNAARVQAAQTAAAAGWNRAARDPLLRRLVTAHILALASVPDGLGYPPDSPNRCAHWLELISSLDLSDLPDAEYLGWVAYNAGDYTAAQRWLGLARADSPAGLWLQAKLQRRAGKTKEAAASMGAAWKVLRDPASYTGWTGPAPSPSGDERFEGDWTFPESATGDLGALRLERNDLVQALQTLLDGNLWNDAAFVAERVLTASELQKFVE